VGQVNSVVCVMVHGRGQTPGDMEAMVLRHIAVPGVRFHLPQAATRSWYDARAIDPLTPTTQAQLSASLQALADSIADAGPADRIVLAGFSQGACLALEYALRRVHPADAAQLAGLCLFTGCRVGSDPDLPVAPLAGLPVYASIGDDDPWIPLAAHVAANLTLARLGARLRTDVFPGRPHLAGPVEIAQLSAMLSAVTRGDEVFA